MNRRLNAGASNPTPKPGGHRTGLEDDPLRMFALEQAALWRIVVAIALVIAGVAVDALGRAQPSKHAPRSVSENPIDRR